MFSEKSEFIEIDGNYVFLVLTEQQGDDFTFYVPNDKGGIVRRILQQSGGERKDSADQHPDNWELKADEAQGESQTNDLSVQSKPDDPKNKPRSQDYSCRVRILKPLLDAKDLKKDADDVAIFMQKLNAFVTSNNAEQPYPSLKESLPETFSKLPAKNLKDEELIGTLIGELNALLKGDLPAVIFKDPVIADEEKQLLDQVTDEQAKKIMSNRMQLCALFNEEIERLEVKVGRGLAGLSYENKIWAISFREQEKKWGYKPSSYVGDNLNCIEEICQSLYEEIFYAISHSEAVGGKDEQRSGEPPPGKNEEEGEAKGLTYRQTLRKHREGKLPELSGLIVVAGATNSAKSLITRGLIHLYLENVKIANTFKRRPHLVTFEDPIEKYFAEDRYILRGTHAQADVVMSAFTERIDYTPRQREIDVENLQEALRSALRQTPKVFFVGETRDSVDWRALIDFAGTGHMVVTTAHAGSLIETMHKIFLATGAKTPAARGEVAGRLLAIVHLKRMELSGCKCGVLVPAIWRRVPRGLNALTAEGLASVLPHSHSDAGNPCSCLGRKYFVGKLLELAGDRDSPEDYLTEDFKKTLRLQATDWDLQGA